MLGGSRVFNAHWRTRMVQSGHSTKAGGGEPITLARDAMGTRFELIIVPEAGGPPVATLRAAAGEALDEIERLHRLLSPFDPASEVAALNRAAGSGLPQPVTPELFDLLILAEAVRAESAGAFDCTLGALMCSHGFRGPPQGAAPGTRLRVLTIDRAARAVTLGPGVAIDLGAIAKGWALDVAAAALREAGVSCALLHGGTSSVLAIGAPPGTPGWRVGLRLPGATEAPTMPLVVLRDLALGVSAPHGRLNERGEGHVLDPRSGNSVPSGAYAACVSPSAALADAWSTAALVQGSRGEVLPAATGRDVTTYLVQAVGMPPLCAGPRPGVFEFPGAPRP